MLYLITEPSNVNWNLLITILKKIVKASTESKYIVSQRFEHFQSSVKHSFLLIKQIYLKNLKESLQTSDIQRLNLLHRATDFIGSRHTSEQIQNWSNFKVFVDFNKI
jgi:hypothetical protein